jgi:DNA-binding TFAR19-related protein (PDSD5 family)
MVNKEKVRAIEESLIAAATSGKLQSKVSEEQLIAMLEQGDGPVATKKSGVVMQRRKYGMDDDDDDDDSDLM